MLKKNLLVTLLFIVSLCGFADGNKVYSITEYQWLYDDLERLMLESRISPLSSTYPFTGNEIEYVLSEISVSSLSNQGSILYFRVLETIDPQESKKGVSYDFGLEVNVETYLQTEKDNDEWIYDYYDRQALFELDFEFGVNDIFWAGVSIPFQKGMDYYRYSDGAESNLTLLWNLDQIDAQFPFFALSSLGGDNWSVLFGRDLLNYGVGESGSFTISDDASYHDFFRASTFWDKFKYTFTLVNIDAIDVDGLTSYDADEDITTDYKFFIGHNFEFRPFNNFSISLNEALTRGGGPMTLGYLNPFMVLHNLSLTDITESIYGNSVMTISGEYTPFRNISIYGEFCLDQYQTISEGSRDDEDYDGDPNAYGFLFGATYLLNRDKVSVLFNAEFAYTNPYLYRSTDSWSLYAITMYYHSVYNDSNDTVVESLGYEYGPDIVLLNLSVDTTLLDGDLTIYFEYINILKGECDLTDSTDDDDSDFWDSPSGDTIFERNIFTLNTEYMLTDWASVYSQISALFYQNVDNEEGDDITDFQFVFGTNLKFF